MHKYWWWLHKKHDVDDDVSSTLSLLAFPKKKKKKSPLSCPLSELQALSSSFLCSNLLGFLLFSFPFVSFPKILNPYKTLSILHICPPFSLYISKKKKRQKIRTWSHTKPQAIHGQNQTWQERPWFLHYQRHQQSCSTYTLLLALRLNH